MFEINKYPLYQWMNFYFNRIREFKNKVKENFLRN